MLSLLYVITYYKLNVIIISPFEARACRDYIFYLRYPMYNRVFLHSAWIISIVKYSKFYVPRGGPGV